MIFDAENFKSTERDDRKRFASFKKRLVSRLSQPFAPQSKMIRRPLFIQWLDENKFFIRNSKGNPDESTTKARHAKTNDGASSNKFDHDGSPEYTFTGMDGWKAKVPADRMWEAFYWYSKSLDKKEKLFAVEVMWQKRVLCFDFDFGKKLEWAYIKRCMNLLQSILEFFFHEEDPATQKRTTCMVMLSNGEFPNVHIVFPYLIVDYEFSMVLWYVVVTAFSSYLGSYDAAKPWSSVIDPSIYSSSLRMLGSWKIAVCPCQKIEGYFGCTKCINGRIEINRQYQLSYILNPDGSENHAAVEELKKNTHQRVLMSCLFTDQSVPLTPYKKCEHVPKSFAPDQLKLLAIPAPYDKEIRDLMQDMRHLYESALVKHHEETTRKALTAHSNIKKLVSRKIQIEPSDPIFLATQRWMQQSLPAEYSKLEIGQMFTDEKKSMYIIQPIGIGSRFCQNLNPRRSHTNKTIYFRIYRNGGVCVQCCTSQKPGLDRAYGPCIKFKSRGVELNTEMQHKLFPYIPPERKAKAVQKSNISSMDQALRELQQESKQSDSLDRHPRYLLSCSPEMIGAIAPMIPNKEVNRTSQDWLVEQKKNQEKVKSWLNRHGDALQPKKRKKTDTEPVKTSDSAVARSDGTVTRSDGTVTRSDGMVDAVVRSDVVQSETIDDDNPKPKKQHKYVTI
jgi:hypothetical protein